MRRSVRWTAACLYAAAIFVSSSFETATPIGKAPGLDKLLHAIAYFLLAGLLHRALSGAGRAVKAAVVAAVIASAYGITDEVHQAFVPGRVSSACDVLADALGAAAWIAVVWFARRGKATLPR